MTSAPGRNPSQTPAATCSSSSVVALDVRDDALGVGAQGAQQHAALDRVHAQQGVRVGVRAAGEPLQLLQGRCRRPGRGRAGTSGTGSAARPVVAGATSTALPDSSAGAGPAGPRPAGVLSRSGRGATSGEAFPTGSVCGAATSAGGALASACGAVPPACGAGCRSAGRWPRPEAR